MNHTKIMSNHKNYEPPQTTLKRHQNYKRYEPAQKICTITKTLNHLQNYDHHKKFGSSQKLETLQNYKPPQRYEPQQKVFLFWFIIVVVVHNFWCGSFKDFWSSVTFALVHDFVTVHSFVTFHNFLGRFTVSLCHRSLLLWLLLTFYDGSRLW